MDAYWVTAYLVLAGLVVVQAFLLTLQTWEHRRYVRSCMRSLERHNPTGRVTLFAPCKGVDLEFEENLRSLLAQDYKNYEIIFVVESENDPAYAVIQRVMAQHSQVSSRLVVAGRSEDTGQKVHNLLAALSYASPDTEYFAFVDSDARPRAEWLRAMIARLEEDPDLGAVTGYRWFTPDRPTVANALVYSMNCDVMSLLTRSSHYLIWGGSWAIRRSVFESLNIADAWRGTISDDLVASRLMRASRKKVRFEPACVVASPLDVSFAQALSFIRRQYLVARLYTFDWWLFSLIATTFSNGIWLCNLAALVTAILTGAISPAIPLAVSAVLYLLTVYRGLLRQSLVATYFPHWEKASGGIRGFDIWANPLVEFAHWIGISCSAFGWCVKWRGICYRMLRGGLVSEIIREEPLVRMAKGRQNQYRKAG